ncbi:hypothetical protein H1R20_g1938, partial [Candolleomyces eurysporus]
MSSSSTTDALHAQVDRMRLEIQSLSSEQGKEQISIGNYLLARLTQLGVTHMFGVPGDFNLAFLDLVEDHPSIEWVGNCNELNSAYAADGYARVKNQGLGVVLTTFGVGELSATNGIAGAFSEMVPVLSIAGVPSTVQQKKHYLLHHTLGDGRYDAYAKAAEQFTTHQAYIKNAATAAVVIDEAIVQCLTKAIYLTLPTDLVYAEVSSERLQTPLRRNVPLNDPQSEEFVLDQIETRVKDAGGDVVVLVDACVIRYNIKAEVMDFLKRTGFPVYAAPMGKTAVDENWERYGGIYVGSITDPVIKENIEKAKLILSIGSLQSDFNSGNFSYNIPIRRHIELHSDHTQVQYAMYPGIGFKQLLPKLTERLEKFHSTGSQIPVAPYIAQLPSDSTQVITQRWFWPRLGSYFKSGDLIVTETGTANFGILDVPLPPKTMLVSQILWGSIGWSVGACLGAAIAGRELDYGRTILFVGDGSMQLTVQELSPMIRLGLKPIIFLLNNSGYVIERTIHGKHRKYNDIADWKWTELLDVLGDRKTETKSYKVSTRDELDALFKDEVFLSNKTITLVEVTMDRLDAPRLLEAQVEVAMKTKCAEDIVRITKEAIEKDREVQDKVGKLDPKDCTFESVFLPLAQADTEIDRVTEPLSFYLNVSPTKEIRDASNEADSLLRDFSVESSMRLDVFDAKTAAEKNIKESGQWEKLSDEDRRLIDKMVLDGTRAGLALPEEKREELKKLKKELSQTCLEFSKNFNEEKSVITFTEEELKGVPKDVISGYGKRTEGDKTVYDVTYKTPDIFPIFKFAENPTTRQLAQEGYEARLEINVPLLDKVLDLRRRIAALLGYKTWADYITEVKMIKTGDGIKKFLDDLESKLRPVGEKEKAILLEIKKKEHEELGLPFDGEFYLWDYRYYDRKYIEKTLDLDDMLVKEYFPVSVVVPTILQIYQDLLGVQFYPIEGTVWHPEVQQFAVWEKDAKDQSGFIGYCYLDLFPRENKYSHAAVWGLLSGFTNPDGSRSYPLAAMVANLAKPTGEKPALMTHDDVVTFFHEMGHVFHGLLSKTKYARFHGTSVARDFVEAPSQMLESWCWEPKVLEKMSSHYKTKEALSPELIDKIIKSRYVNVGLFYLRQLFFAKFDYKVHTDQEKEDYTNLWCNLREQVSLVKSKRFSPGQGTFGHITGGYDAGYYGYTYSLVFAADMYRTVFKADPLDPARGKLYRDKILRWGGSREELDSLKDFLGREPNSNAFLEEVFGTVPPSHL